MKKQNTQNSEKKQRKLTAAEQKRAERFSVTKAQLEAEGYQTHDLTVGMVYANIMAIVLCTPLIALFVFAYFLMNPFSDGIDFSLIEFGTVMVAFLVLIVVHELIHGLTWALFAPNHWKSISFGFIAQYLTPYCTCNAPQRKWQYITACIMPLLLLGILPSIIAVFIGSIWLLMIGLFMILGGGGDLTIILTLLRFKSDAKELLYLDHPFEGGLVVFTR